MRANKILWICCYVEEKVFDFQQECKQNSDCLFLLKCMEVEVWKLHTHRNVWKKNFEEGKPFILLAGRFVIYVHSSTM